MFGLFHVKRNAATYTEVVLEFQTTLRFLVDGQATEIQTWKIDDDQSLTRGRNLLNHLASHPKAQRHKAEPGVLRFVIRTHKGEIFAGAGQDFFRITEAGKELVDFVTHEIATWRDEVAPPQPLH